LAKQYIHKNLYQKAALYIRCVLLETFQQSVLVHRYTFHERVDLWFSQKYTSSQTDRRTDRRRYGVNSSQYCGL